MEGEESAGLKMTEVILHVYDVTNSGNDKTNNTIMQINKIFKDGIGLGGIFHSAVQVPQFPLCSVCEFVWVFGAYLEYCLQWFGIMLFYNLHFYIVLSFGWFNFGEFLC